MNTENSTTTITNGSSNGTNAAAGTTTAKFTMDQVINAASFVKVYMDVNHNLPDYVTIGTYNVYMPSFLELLTTTVLQINSGTTTSIDLMTFGMAPVPRDSVQSGDMAKAEYLAIAANVKSFMDSKMVAPEYAYNTSLGFYFGYQNLVYTYAKILDSYATNKVLPASVGLKSWKFLSDANTATFTLDQVGVAATWVKSYVEVNFKLPDYVTIGAYNVSMSSFLELLTTSVLQISNGTGTSVDYVSFGTAPVPRDTVQSGNMAKAEYLQIAANVKSFMDRTGVAPEYAYNTSLGLYFGYQNMVYIYSKILDSYSTNKVLPASVGLKPWSLVINPPVSFTVDQVVGAATWVKNYVETNHKLPDYVTIGAYNVSMPSFLELLTTSVLQISNGTGITVDYVSFGTAPVPRDTVQSGNMAKAEYLQIAANVKSFMDSKKVGPEYAYNTSLGLYFGYQNLVYTYSKILDSYATNKVLHASVSLRPWRFVSDANVATFTVNQVGVAATWVTNYVETNHNLPDYVTIGSFNVSMPSFLELLTTSVLLLNNGADTLVDFTSFGSAPVPRDTIQDGNIYTAEYLAVAGNVKSFMDSTGVAPEYAYNTSLGYYLGYQNLVYMYAMILDYDHTSGKIAEWAVMKPWIFVSNLNWVYITGLKYYEQPNDYSCGPSSLKMALSTFGLNLYEGWLEQVAWTSSETGTSHAGLINAVSSVNANYGINFSFWDQTFTSTGWLGLLNMYISKNCPVILHIQSFWNPTTSGHYVVLTGINRAEGKVRIADPSAATGYEFKVLSFSELEQRMQWVINTGRSSEPVMPLIMG